MKMKWLVAGASVAMVLTSCGGDDGGSSSSFCKAAQATNDSSDAFSKILSSGTEPDAKETKAAIADVIKKAKSALKSAPGEIKDALQTSIDGFESFEKIFEDNDYDFEKIADDAEFQKLVQDEDFSTSSDKVREFLDTECGITDTDTDGSNGGDTTVAPDTTAKAASDATPKEATQAQIDALKSFLPKLDETQIKCLIEKGFSVSGGEAPNPNILGDCNIDLTDLTPGG